MSTPLFDLTLTEEQRITRESMRRLARDTLSNQARAADDAAAADAGRRRRGTRVQGWS